MKPFTAIAKRSLQATLAALLTLGLSSFGATMAHADDTPTTISGSVTLNGEAAAGLEVCAYAPRAVDDLANAVGSCVFTDATGQYQFVFALPADTEMASVWVNPGSGDTFPRTTYGTSLRDHNGYFSLFRGQTRVLAAISLVTEVTSPATPVTSPETPVTSPVTPGTIITGSEPVIGGKVKVGKRLTARAGTWGPQCVQLSYQWQRNGKAIARATGSAYKLTKADRGKKINVKVTGTADGYVPAAKVSKPTKKVAKR